MNLVSQHELYDFLTVFRSVGLAAKELVGVLPTDLEGKLPRTHEIHLHHWRKLQRLCDKERFCVDECVNEFLRQEGDGNSTLYIGRLGRWDKIQDGEIRIDTLEV